MAEDPRARLTRPSKEDALATGIPRPGEIKGFDFPLSAICAVDGQQLTRAGITFPWGHP